MANKICPECEQGTEDMHQACPSCGYPFQSLHPVKQLRSTSTQPLKSAWNSIGNAKSFFTFMWKRSNLSTSQVMYETARYILIFIIITVAICVFVNGFSTSGSLVDP